MANVDTIERAVPTDDSLPEDRDPQMPPSLTISKTGDGQWSIVAHDIDTFAIPTLLRHLAVVLERGLVEGS